MEGFGIHGAGIGGGEVLIGYIWYVLLRLLANGERIRLV